MEGFVSTGLSLKLHSDKNFNVFKQGAHLLKNCQDISGIVGFIYGDFEPNLEIKTRWMREFNNIQVYVNARRKKTVMMDSKISFSRRMCNSIYTPPTYFNISDIPDSSNPDSLFFIKKNGSTGAKHVFVTKYSNINDTVTSIGSTLDDYIIQQSMDNPDLYESHRRYKVRVHVILHDNKVFLHTKHWCTVSRVDYDVSCNDQDRLRMMNVIYQANAEKFITFDDIPNNYDIQQQIIYAIHDFKTHFFKEIQDIVTDEFVILGFDFVVNRDKQVHIIEINHRSNYSHPKDVSDKTDVICMRDLFMLLITKKTDGTDFIAITDQYLSSQ